MPRTIFRLRKKTWPQSGRLTLITRALTSTAGEARPTRVVIEFKDTGEGMSAEQRQRAFTSLLSTTKNKGTGLGLAIAKRIMESHDGAIAAGDAGPGAEMIVTLPRGGR